MKEIVTADTTDGIHTITFDSQLNRNALSYDLVRLTHLALDAAESDGRAVVIRAVGPSFCAGADLKERGSSTQQPDQPDLFERLLQFPLPVVAVVQGVARAGGIGLVAAADIAIGTPAANFSFSEVYRGLVPAIVSVVCGEVIERRALQHYFLTGEVFDGVDAARIGLLSECVGEEELATRLDEVTTLLRRGAPLALRTTKSVLAQRGIEWFARLNEMRSLSRSTFASPEGQEGIHAFLEKREPTWH